MVPKMKLSPELWVDVRLSVLLQLSTPSGVSHTNLASHASMGTYKIVSVGILAITGGMVSGEQNILGSSSVLELQITEELSPFIVPDPPHSDKTLT